MLFLYFFALIYYIKNMYYGPMILTFDVRPQIYKYLVLNFMNSLKGKKHGPWAHAFYPLRATPKFTNFVLLTGHVFTL